MPYARIKKLGRYDVVRELGKGAMGVVLEGNDPLLGRRVALKIVNLLALSGDPTRRQAAVSRFYSEASAAGRLTHPNLMTVYDVGEEEIDGETFYYMALEYLDGVDLSILIREGEPFDPTRALDIVRQVAEGLAVAHDQGVIHRDIKPSNIRVCSGDRVKITDFGLARLPDSSLTIAGAVMGTPQYMPPEQVEGGTSVPASDLFSLTAILYELLTGERPFRAESLSATIAKVLHYNPPPPSEKLSSLGAAFDEIVARGLQKNHQRRIGTGRDYIALLDAAQAKLRAQGNATAAAARPSLACYFDDEGLARKGGRLLKEAGFSQAVFFKSAPVADLGKNIAKRLTEGRWGVVHFKPHVDTTEANRIVSVIDLLRAMRGKTRPDNFARFVPVFLSDTDADRQREVFRRLAPFGVESALFLEPEKSPEANMKLIGAEIDRLAHRMWDETGTVNFYPTQDDEVDRSRGEMDKLAREARDAIARDEYFKAIELLNRALAIAPAPDAFIQRGDAHYRVSHYVEALEDYRAASEMEMNSPETKSRIGACCLSLSALTKEENEDEAALWLATGMQSLAEAEEEIDQLVATYRQEPERLPAHPYKPLISAFREVGTDYGAFDEEGEITGFIQRVVGKAGIDTGAHLCGIEEDQEAFIDYAAMLGTQGDFDGAERILTSLLPKNPTSVGPEMNNLAVKMRKRNMIARAFRVYLKLLDYAVPDREIILQNMRIAGIQLAKASHAKGEGEEALEAFRQVALHSPDGRELLLMEMAGICLERGEEEKGKEFIRQAIRLRPALREDSRYLGYIRRLGGEAEVGSLRPVC